MEMTDALKTNLETIRSYVALNAKGQRGNRDHVIIREACGNVYHDIMRRALDMEPSCQDSGHTYMSKAFHDGWENEKNSKKIIEHVVPMGIIKRRLQNLQELAEIYQSLKENMKIVWVTPGEDNKLNKAGCRAKLPDSGKNRHDEVEIIWKSGPVKFRTVRQRKAKKANSLD